MGNICEIAQLGDPVLRETARSIDDISSPAILRLVEDMFTTVRAANGAGIAAPQISQSERLIVICSRPSPRYPYAPHMEPAVMFNPQIDWQGSELEKDWEGCLSIPGIRALVPRSQSIRVSFQTGDGTDVQCKFDGFIARVFQHEVDHLDGIVYLDRVETSQDIVTEQEFLKKIADRSQGTENE